MENESEKADEGASVQRMLSSKEVSRLIFDAVSVGRPFSLVRIGDGEGAVLLHGKVSATAEDRTYFEGHFGAGFPQETLEVFSRRLREAVSNADIVGIRDDIWNAERTTQPVSLNDADFEEKFRSLLKLRPIEKDISGHALRRFYGIYRWLREEMPDGPQVCSAWISFHLGMDRFWEKLFRMKRRISVINCSPTLPGRLAKDLGLEVEHIRVPDLDRERSQWGDDHGERIFPESYERVISTLDKRQDGKLFLIGAGVPGKAYADFIKQRGGIALDVGGLMDAWDGRATRPAVFATMLPGNAANGHLVFALRPPVHRRLWSLLRR